MELYMCYQNVSEISRVMRFITTEILYLRQNVKTYSRDKRKEKHQTFSAPLDHEDRLSIRPSSFP